MASRKLFQRVTPESSFAHCIKHPQVYLTHDFRSGFGQARDLWFSRKGPRLQVVAPGAAEVYPFLIDCDSLIATPLATKDLTSVMRKVIRIERVNSAEQESGEPLLTPKGYKMADPGGGPDRSRPPHAIFQDTLEGVAAGLQKGLSLWMQEPGKDEALIAANKLRVVYA
jgi:hypothetical protein